MPQLNPDFFAPQIVWLAISFILLYLLMSRVALPRVGSILEERKGRIEGDLAAAAKLREETDAALAAYEQALADAKARAQAIARQARDEMTAEMDKHRAEIDSGINAKIADAEKRVSAMKESATGHISEIATDTADAIIARILGKSADKTEVKSAVNEALGM